MYYRRTLEMLADERLYKSKKNGRAQISWSRIRIVLVPLNQGVLMNVVNICKHFTLQKLPALLLPMYSNT